MPTVAEVLKQSGFSDDQIAAMDQRAITAFSGVLSSAEQERQRAQAERQANIDFYEGQIAPSLVSWDEEKTRLENERARTAAEAAFYRTQAEEARKFGFVPAEAPTFTPARDQGGRYVAGAPGATPGSPQFQPEVLIKRAGDGLGQIADIDWRHRSLFDGKPMPISPSQLIAEADNHHLSPMVYAERRFGFDKREQELAEQRQKDHDDKIRQDAEAARDRVWAEKVGSNPDVRMPMQSPRMTTIARATREGKPFGSDGVVLKDPLMLGEGERRQQTRAAIRSELAEQSS